MEPYLDETAYYDTPNCTWPFGTHIAIVEIDEETGQIELVRYVAVDDVGNKINPMIVDGQLHGGIAQGVGQALWEGAVYDDQGQLLSGSMLDYTMPRASFFPFIELDETVTPSPVNPIGVKGVGEAGAIASTAAVANAVVDALSPLGIRHLDMPYTSQTVWRAIQWREGRPGVIPAAFDYQRPASVDEALRALSDTTGGAKVIAGGQSLLPLLKLRLASADTLVDIGRLAELKAQGPTPDGGYEIGALATYAELIEATSLGWAAEAHASTSATSRSAIAARSAARSPTATRPRTCPRWRWRSTTRSCSARSAASGPCRSTASSRARSRPGWRPTSCSSRSVPRTRCRPAPRVPTGSSPSRRPATRSSGVAAVVAMDGGIVSHARVALTGVGANPYRAKAVEAALARQRRIGRRRSRRLPSTPLTARPSTATSMPTANTGRRMAVVYTRRAIEAALGR